MEGSLTGAFRCQCVALAVDVDHLSDKAVHLVIPSQMAFAPCWSVEALETYNRLKRNEEAALEHRQKSGKSKSSKAEGLFKQVPKCITLLLENPRHPGLQTHEFHSLRHPYDKNAKIFEAYARQKTPAAYRLFWCYGPKQGEITILSITAHP